MGSMCCKLPHSATDWEETRVARGGRRHTGRQAEWGARETHDVVGMRSTKIVDVVEKGVGVLPTFDLDDDKNFGGGTTRCSVHKSAIFVLALPDLRWPV